MAGNPHMIHVCKRFYEIYREPEAEKASQVFDLLSIEPFMPAHEALAVFRHSAKELEGEKMTFLTVRAYMDIAEIAGIMGHWMIQTSGRPSCKELLDYRAHLDFRHGGLPKGQRPS